MAYKRFMLFETDTYYPGGGLSDCSGDFNTLEEAIAAMTKSRSDDAYVFDRIEGVEVERR